MVSGKRLSGVNNASASLLVNAVAWNFGLLGLREPPEPCSGIAIDAPSSTRH